MSNVDIYTSETCHFCHAAKEFFDQNNVKYTEHSITKDPGARKELMKKGVMSVPFIVIDGEEIMGFDKEKISDILKI
jgi:Glutaredoxin and related proteins